MTFWTYLFVNTALSLAVAAILIWTKPENRAKRAEAKMRREEDLFNMILEAAKRIDEERKPNPDFTPPPEKKPPAPQVNLCDNCRYRNQLCHKTGIRKCSNYIEAGPPKPPTTGTSVIEPKKHKYDKFSCLCFPFCNLTREQVLEGLDRYIKGFSSNDLLDRVENEMKRIKDDQRTGTQPIQSFFGEVRGGPGNQVLGTVTAKSAEELEEKLKALSDTLDRTDKKPVTPERLKEAGFTVAPVHSCGSCYWFSEGGGGKFGLCIRNDEIADRDGQKACFDPQERRSKVRPKPLGTVTTRRKE